MNPTTLRIVGISVLSSLFGVALPSGSAFGWDPFLTKRYAAQYAATGLYERYNKSHNIQGSKCGDRESYPRTVWIDDDIVNEGKSEGTDCSGYVTKVWGHPHHSAPGENVDGSAYTSRGLRRGDAPNTRSYKFNRGPDRKDAYTWETSRPDMQMNAFAWNGHTGILVNWDGPLQLWNTWEFSPEKDNWCTRATLGGRLLTRSTDTLLKKGAAYVERASWGGDAYIGSIATPARRQGSEPPPVLPPPQPGPPVSPGPDPVPPPSTPSQPASSIRQIAPTPDGAGYWMVGHDGGVFAFGSAGFFGSLPGLDVHVVNIVGIASTASGRGYWLVGSDGGVFAFGDAPFHGSLPGIGVQVNNIIGIATAPGDGYWLVGRDGGVFAFGAPFYGSLPGLGISVGNIVAIATAGWGYWLVGSDGGVFAFGSAPFFGSVPGLGIQVNNIVALGSSPSGGYWLVGNDGGVFSFGPPFHGSLPGLGIAVSNVIGIAASAGGGGYWLAGCDGGLFTFGAAAFHGRAPEFACSVGVR